MTINVGLGHYVGFAFSYVVGRVAIIFKYLIVVRHVPRAKVMITRLIQSYLVSCVFWISSMFGPPEWAEAAWAIGLAIEFGMLLYPHGEKHRLPMHISHTAERQGLFVMLILGEGIISLVIAEGKKDTQLQYSDKTSQYLMIVCGFGLIFNLSLKYFDVSPFEAPFHAMRRGRVASRILLVSHLLLCGAFLAVGSSLKICLTRETNPMTLGETILVCWSVGFSLLLLQIIRATHLWPPILENYRVHAAVLKILRVLIPVCVGLLPTIPGVGAKPLALVFGLFIITAFQVFLDTYGHTLEQKLDHRRQKRALKRARQEEARLRGESVDEGHHHHRQRGRHHGHHSGRASPAPVQEADLEMQHVSDEQHQQQLQLQQQQQHAQIEREKDSWRRKAEALRVAFKGVGDSNKSTEVSADPVPLPAEHHDDVVVMHENPAFAAAGATVEPVSQITPASSDQVGPPIIVVHRSSV
eukprot:TRINITY_DN1492_c0_g1_i2.p1 TRINITY_DN1492_c0_g1~~TRINITY_DN1492_c0_g1_i2.p1  ORF type:complete len:469 (+),score=107.59 TRINITY_DN1492_c0_g1_i2:708-2114(+)